MPIYEYECKKCGHKFELMRHISENDKGIVCPDCGATGPTRTVSKFASHKADSGCAPAPSGG